MTLKKLRYKKNDRVIVTVFGKEYGFGYVVEIWDRTESEKPYRVMLEGMTGSLWVGEKDLRKAK